MKKNIKLIIGLAIVLIFSGCSSNSNLTSKEKSVLSHSYDALSLDEKVTFEELIRRKDLTSDDKNSISKYINANITNAELKKIDLEAINGIDESKPTSSVVESNEPKKDDNKSVESSDNYNKGLEAFNKQEYQKAIEYFGQVASSDPNSNKAYEYATKAYEKMPITNETINNKGKWFFGKWFIVDILNFKINTIQAMTTINGHKSADGKAFIVIDVTIKNMTGQGEPADGYGGARNVNINSSLNFRLYDDSKRNYNDLQIGNNTMNGILTSGSEMRGELVYEIPTNLGLYYFEGIMNNNNYKIALSLK